MKKEAFGRCLFSASAYLLFLLTSWASAAGAAATAAEYPSHYDAHIKTAVDKWWLDFPDWRWLKAQYWQESRLDPTARSGVGAEGIAQAMPGTWVDVIRALNWPTTVSRRDAAYAIEGGAYYQMKQRMAWRATGRTPAQRNDLGLAAYNAGLGNILKAQKLCDDKPLWEHIAPCLERVTGQYSAETLDYIVKINRWHAQMETR